MNLKAYVVTSALIFALVAVLQLVRVLAQWDVQIEGTHIPLWASGVAIVVAGLLSFAGFRQAARP